MPAGPLSTIGVVHEHSHRTSEEIRLFLSGMGTMERNGNAGRVRAVHELRNRGT